ncbi:MAG TPA: hypothetical protein VIL86_09120 [Tepidisphaeraceae bacterium]
MGSAMRQLGLHHGRASKAVGAPVDPLVSAKEAGLHYVSDAKPGIARERNGKGFVYVGPNGKAVKDTDTLARIRSLVIPPAWTDVWITTDPLGHLQATGRDARGRKQHRYHPRWRSVRDQTKFDKMLAFAAALPLIRRKTTRHLRLSGLPRQKVLAAVVQLLRGRCWRRWRCRNSNLSTRRRGRRKTWWRPLSRWRRNSATPRRCAASAASIPR